MVTNWIMDAFLTVWGWFWAVIPDPPVIPWDDFTGATTSFLSQIAALLPWAETFMPVKLAAVFLGLWLAAWAIAVGIKLGRTLLSLFTLGGGM